MQGQTLEKIAEVFDGKNALIGDTEKEVSNIREEVVTMKH